MRIWPEVLERFPGAVLLLVGDGPDRPRLERMVARRGVGGSVRAHRRGAATRRCRRTSTRATCSRCRAGPAARARGRGVRHRLPRGGRLRAARRRGPVGRGRRGAGRAARRRHGADTTRGGTPERPAPVAARPSDRWLAAVAARCRSWPCASIVSQVRRTCPVTTPPSAKTMTTMSAAIATTRSPYSTALAPRSSRCCDRCRRVPSMASASPVVESVGRSSGAAAGRRAGRLEVSVLQVVVTVALRLDRVAGVR